MSLIRFERRILITGLVAMLPALAALVVMAFVALDGMPRWTALGSAAASVLTFLLAVRMALVYPLRTLSNLIGALREGDYSIRVRGARDDAMGEVASELNRLTDALPDHRLDAL